MDYDIYQQEQIDREIADICSRNGLPREVLVKAHADVTKAGIETKTLVEFVRALDKNPPKG